MGYSIKQHLNYNLWANIQLVQVLTTVDEEILNSHLRSSFSGITKTLMHISDAEVIWLTRLQGQSLTDWPSDDFSGTKEAVFQRLLKSSAELVSFIESKGDPFLSSVLHYKTMKGESFSNEVEALLNHIVNHGTYHRGQIVTMLRGAGITTLPSTDLIRYLRTL